MNSNIKHISHEDFKKLDINEISYVQMNNGEILIIDHPIIQNISNIEDKNKNIKKEDNLSNEKKANNKKRKKKKNKKKNKNIESTPLLQENNKSNDVNQYQNYYNYYNYDQNNDKYSDNKIYNYLEYEEKEEKFTLPNVYFERKPKRAYSVKIQKKDKILFNEEWRDIQDYDVKERLKFYDSIPERAKYWERESYDATRSSFQTKRNAKMNDYNNYNQNIMTNYNPIPQYSSEEDEYDESYNLYNSYNNNNYEFPYNQIKSEKDLYNLAFGPLFSQYLLGQQGNDGETYYNKNEGHFYHTSQYDFNDNNQNYFYQDSNDYYGPYYKENEKEIKNLNEDTKNKK